MLSLHPALTIRIAWFENLDVVSVGAAPGSVAEEGSQPLVYTFSRVGGTLEPVTIAFEIAGAVRLGQDYTASGAASFNGTTGTVVIPAGATSAQVNVHPIDDLLAELDEHLRLTIVAGPGYVVGDSASATGIITSAEDGGDFGDAPSGYPTLLAKTGHAIVGGCDWPRAGGDTGHRDGWKSVLIGKRRRHIAVDRLPMTKMASYLARFRSGNWVLWLR